jgi:hypothetical protein
MRTPAAPLLASHQDDGRSSIGGEAFASPMPARGSPAIKSIALKSLRNFTNIAETRSRFAAAD